MSLVACLSLLIFFINLVETRVQEGVTYLVLEPVILLNILLSPREPRNARMSLGLYWFSSICRVFYYLVETHTTWVSEFSWMPFKVL